MAKCPNCEESFTEIKAQSIPVSRSGTTTPSTPPGGIAPRGGQVIVYLCPKCDTVLGVGEQ